MYVRPQDSRRRSVAPVAQKDGSRFHAGSAPDWTRRPTTRWSRLTDNLIFAGILAMGGWLIFASVEPSPRDPAMSTEEFVDRSLSRLMSTKHCQFDSRETSESRSPRAIEEFEQSRLYHHIFHQANQFARERGLMAIREDPIG